MKQLCLAFLFLMAATISATAQKISIDNIRKTALRTSDAIRQGADVKGYYFFYVSDKIDKKRISIPCVFLIMD